MSPRNCGKIHSGIIALIVLFLAACSSPQKTEPAPSAAEAEKPTQPKVECFAGCQLSEEGACQTVASVTDWNSVEKQRVDCDPRCCDPDFAGAKVDLEGNPDTDDDGIFDDRDECPEEPEDYDGYQDEDGCPEKDNDGDGIPDDADVCPLDAEDIDGFQDDDGCPDV